MAVKKWSAMKIALATFLCILSPACLLFLVAAQESNMIAMSENAVGGIGIITLILLVSVAVVVFIICGNRTQNLRF